MRYRLMRYICRCDPTIHVYSYDPPIIPPINDRIPPNTPPVLCSCDPIDSIKVIVGHTVELGCWI